jgi:site-specific DNA recombinase
VREQLEQEYQQRLQTVDASPELHGLQASLGRLRQGVARLIDSYAEGVIDKAEFDPRMRERIKQIEEHVQQIQDEAGLQREIRLIIGR